MGKWMSRHKATVISWRFPCPSPSSRQNQDSLLGLQISPELTLLLAHTYGPRFTMHIPPPLVSTSGAFAEWPLPSACSLGGGPFLCLMFLGWGESKWSIGQTESLSWQFESQSEWHKDEKTVGASHPVIHPEETVHPCLLPGYPVHP